MQGIVGAVSCHPACRPAPGIESFSRQTTWEGLETLNAFSRGSSMESETVELAELPKVHELPQVLDWVGQRDSKQSWKAIGPWCWGRPEIIGNECLACELARPLHMARCTSFLKYGARCLSRSRTPSSTSARIWSPKASAELALCPSSKAVRACLCCASPDSPMDLSRLEASYLTSSLFRVASFAMHWGPGA